MSFLRSSEACSAKEGSDSWGSRQQSLFEKVEVICLLRRLSSSAPRCTVSARSIKSFGDSEEFKLSLTTHKSVGKISSRSPSIFLVEEASG